MKKEEIGKNIHMLSKQIKIKVDFEVAKYGITGTQAGILNFINENSKHKDIYAKDIEKSFDIKGASVAGILQLMEKKDLIQRIPISEDARYKKLILTKKAEEITKNINKELEKVENLMTYDMTKDEINLFLELVKKLMKNLCNYENNSVNYLLNKKEGGEKDD